MKSIFGETKSSCGHGACRRNRIVQMKRAMASGLALLMLLVPIMTMIPGVAFALELDGGVGDFDASLESTLTAPAPENPDPESAQKTESGQQKQATPAPTSIDIGPLNESTEDSSTLQAGKIYLADVTFGGAVLGTTTTSGGNFNTKAVIEVTETDNIVTIFQTK